MVGSIIERFRRPSRSPRRTGGRAALSRRGRRLFRGVRRFQSAMIAIRATAMSIAITAIPAVMRVIPVMVRKS